MSDFNAQCYLQHSTVTANCLSVCPSVTLRKCDHTVWNTLKTISWMISLGFLLSAWICSKETLSKFWPE